MSKDVKYIQQLLEKDICYIKEKVDKIENHLSSLNGQVEENTDFRKKFKWTGTLIGVLASVVSFGLMIISYKMQWLGR